MATDAQKAATARYLNKMYTLPLRMTPDQRDAIRCAAQNAGQSLNAYIMQAIKMRMISEKDHL